jgi:antirestriction protein ArdC
MKTRKPDFRQEVTDEVIRLIEAGTAPWIVPWQTGEIAAAFNPTTNIPYRGGNIIALMCASMRKGYKDPRWMTYRQAAETLLESCTVSPRVSSSRQLTSLGPGADIS